MKSLFLAILCMSFVGTSALAAGSTVTYLQCDNGATLKVTTITNWGSSKQIEYKASADRESQPVNYYNCYQFTCKALIGSNKGQITISPYWIHLDFMGKTIRCNPTL